MDLQVALNEKILARVLTEAVRRGDVVMTVDPQGQERYSAAPREPVVSLRPPLA